MKQSGFTEGENITVEYHWAEGRYERLPQQAQELVKHRVAVIAVGSPPATFAAKSATSTIPIVFILADDPVKESTDSDLEAAFATAAERHIDGLVISDQPFFTARHHRIVALAERYE